MKSFLATVFALFLFVPTISNAAHVVGGELNYTCLGGSQYEINLELYRDCFCTDCADFDTPAYITIFKSNFDVHSVIELNLDLQTEVQIIELPDTVCQELISLICREKSLGYITTVNLNPLQNEEKHLVYQRCCRNNTITNILQPGAVGLTLQTTIPPDSIATCNNSPNFINDPNFITCIGDTLTIDHSAFDLDGDSLSYRFCTSNIGANQAAPYPLEASKPPYDFVNWGNGFDENNQIVGDININSETGLITLFPTQNGVFLISVCVSEYRNGLFLSEKLRDFEIYVYDPTYIPPVSIEDYNFVDGSINYNQDKNQLLLQDFSATQYLNLNVFDLNGKSILQNVKALNGAINLPKLETGMYVAHIISNDAKHQKTLRFIKLI